MSDSQPPETTRDLHVTPSPTGPRSAFGSPWVVLLVLGLLALAVGALVRPDVVERSRNTGYSPVARTQANMRSLATALESYAVDNRAYPPHATGPRGTNGWAPLNSRVASIPTFALGPGGGPYLTTPVSYITRIPDDVFASDHGATFGYYSNGHAWMLFSPGPDGVYNVPDPSILLIPGTDRMDSRRLGESTYDPTNGSISRGDIFKTGGEGWY